MYKYKSNNSKNVFALVTIFSLFLCSTKSSLQNGIISTENVFFVFPVLLFLSSDINLALSFNLREVKFSKNFTNLLAYAFL